MEESTVESHTGINIGKGLTVHVYAGDISKAAADGITVVESRDESSSILSLMEDQFPDFKTNREKLFKQKGGHLDTGKVYLSQGGTHKPRIFHVVCPRESHPQTASVYSNVLSSAEESGCTSVAVPFLAAGTKMEDVDLLCRGLAMYSDTREGQSEESKLEKVLVVLFDGPQTKLVIRGLEDRFGTNVHPLDPTEDGESETDSRKTDGGCVKTESRKTGDGESETDSRKTDGGCVKTESRKTGDGESETDSRKTGDAESETDSRKTDGGCEKSEDQEGKTEAQGESVEKQLIHETDLGSVAEQKEPVEEDMEGVQATARSSLEDVGCKIGGGSSLQETRNEVGDLESDMTSLAIGGETQQHLGERECSDDLIAGRRQLNSSDQPKEEESPCVICQEEITDPSKLDKCGHVFCRDCIDASFRLHRPVCPQCFTAYGEITGNMPRGEMNKYTSEPPGVPGYEKYGVITINYYFPNGVQTSEHPKPGVQFRGTSRTAYLPDCAEGRKVLKLLEVAWKRRLLFTVGRSATTGQDNVVTWNDIHHKTCLSGGQVNFGYPDDSYLSRVTEELACKGVTEADF